MNYPTYPYPGFQPYYPSAHSLANLAVPPITQPFQTAGAQTPSVPAAPPDERIWVQGEGAAASWPVTANGFVRLWDSTAPVYYEKRADAQGKPLPLEVYDYKRRGGEPSVPASVPNYEDRLNAIEARLAAVEGNHTIEKEAVQ